jgi:predicted Fe-S protein YdhL (DUF1289 family)
MSAIQPARHIPSPCIGICRTELGSELCIGCARTRREIAVWRETSTEFRDRVWKELPARRTALGIRMSRLGWGEEEIHAFIGSTLTDRGGTWVLGVPGAVAEFSVEAEEPMDTDIRGRTMTCITDRGAVYFEVSSRLRALELLAPGEPGNVRAIIIALPRERLNLPFHTALTYRGQDWHGLRESDRLLHLFDLGFGFPASQFCVRTGDPSLIAELDRASGAGWRTVLAKLGPRIVEASPHRVVRTALGRAEVFTLIPKPGGVSPSGPHTHLLPDHLAEAREMPPGAELPAAYAPAAIFYPRAGYEIPVGRSPALDAANAAE